MRRAQPRRWEHRKIYGHNVSWNRVARWQALLEGRRVVPLALALLLSLYGGLLRLDAFVGKYGRLDHPSWARILTHDVAPVGASLRPSSITWTPETRPYVGGDPIN